MSGTERWFCSSCGEENDGEDMDSDEYTEICPNCGNLFPTYLGATDSTGSDQ